MATGILRYYYLYDRAIKTHQKIDQISILKTVNLFLGNYLFPGKRLDIFVYLKSLIRFVTNMHYQLILFSEDLKNLFGV